MAALIDPMASTLDIVELRHLTGRELDPLLLEETVEWQRELDWDFSRSADLVRQFADMRALNGYALLDHGEVVGYGYSVLEDQRGLIGDLYLRPPWRNGANEVRLFRTILDALIATPSVWRIESQLMLVIPSIGYALAKERPVKLQERMLMKLDASSPSFHSAGAALRRFYIEPWADHHHEMAATVISLAYGEHIDSQINEQYRTVPGARRFLYNIVQFPGCGVFFRPGSFVAFDAATGWMAGIVLVSFIGDEVGHITQLCVTPRAQGNGLGYELLREAVNTLRMHGARRISLTVTKANTEAIELYHRCGFQDVRDFLSYVWEGRQ
ncbi:MAG TPA: GNAT family N-acetyltransferase [Bryobacteraceae bacterium]|jgi:GNAT superfamily N-acetyltransferase|nr:GNAT family N-acetyltransferase [Bryobacteraceae bacterium]